MKEAAERAKREDELIRKYDEQQAQHAAAEAAAKAARAAKTMADIEQASLST